MSDIKRVVEEINYFEEFDRQNVTNKLEEFIFQPHDPNVSFDLGYNYYKMGHWASALSFFLRAAERSNDKLLTYESLLRAADCYDRQGIRKFTVKGLLQQALTICPDRPEAYVKLSMILEQNYNGDGRWFDSYTIACLGLSNTTDDNPPLMKPYNYLGRYTLLFQKAHTGWHCGLCDQAREIFQDLLDNYEMNSFYFGLVKLNITKIEKPEDLHKVYESGSLDVL